VGRQAKGQLIRFDRLTPSNKESIMSSNIHNDLAGIRPRSFPVLTKSAFAVGALLVSIVAAAAAGDLAEPQARYQQERAICMNGQSHQDRATCLREADAALAESKRGDLSGGPDRYEQNQLMRCEFHPAEDREFCLRRMRGEGTISGSVESGGIYRELRTTVPAK
jgi:hypothetical protein